MNHAKHKWNPGIVDRILAKIARVLGVICDVAVGNTAGQNQDSSS